MPCKAIVALAASLLTAATFPANADLYDPATLADLRHRLEPRITSTVHQDIAMQLPRHVRPAVAAITVKVTRKGSSPLDFHAIPATGTIVVPAESVRFLDDVATLQAYFIANGCDPGFPASYLSLTLGEARQMPNPLAAFGIDRKAAHADPNVGDVSLREHQTMIFFILAHEVGHVLLGHNGPVDPAESQRREIEADAVALNVFAELGEVPAGLPTLFMTSMWLDPSALGAAASSHPLSYARLQAVADRLDAEPGAFAARQSDPVVFQEVVLGIGDRMRQIASLMRDGNGFEALRAGLPQRYPARQFATACP